MSKIFQRKTRIHYINKHLLESFVVCLIIPDRNEDSNFFVFIGSLNTDNSKVFTDIKMNPTELIKVSRKRRNIISNDESNQRRKRSLSSYDIYNTDPVFTYDFLLNYF